MRAGLDLFAGRNDSEDPSAVSLELLVLLLDLTSRLQCREATLDSGRAKHIRPAFAAFETRIDHKLTAPQRCGPATRQQQLQSHLQKCCRVQLDSARGSIPQQS